MPITTNTEPFEPAFPPATISMEDYRLAEGWAGVTKFTLMALARDDGHEMLFVMPPFRRLSLNDGTSGAFRAAARSGFRVEPSPRGVITTMLARNSVFGTHGTIWKALLALRPLSAEEEARARAYVPAWWRLGAHADGG